MVEELSVSVVVPTAGGRDWRIAVASAYLQTDTKVEVLLVNNGVRQIHADPSFPELRILTCDPSLGANGARQLGVANASNAIVALLDDDDEWLPDKLIEQWQFVQANVFDPMNSAWICGAGQLITQKGRETKLAPKVFSPGAVEDVASYLFLRKKVRASHNQLQSSTLLFPRFVAETVPFDSTLRLHQDWSWLLEVEEQLRATILVCPQYLVRYHKGTLGITQSTKPRQSLAWAADKLALRPRNVQGDFVLTVPYNMALEAGQLVEAATIFVYAIRFHSPGVHAVVRAVLAIMRQGVLRVKNRIRTDKRITG